MIFFIACCSVCALFCFFVSVPYCHMLQLEGYQNKSYLKWLASAGRRYYSLVLAMAALFILATMFPYLVSGLAGEIIGWILLAALALLGLIYIAKITVKNAKKPLVYTARVRRMLVTDAILAVGFSLLGFFCGVTILAILVVACPLLIACANAVNAPIENAVKRHYFNDAKKRIAARSDLIKIGITGSYGKTSTKFILGTILSEKYDVLVPPSSFNTPMGLTRVIREQMTDHNQVFIAEMGAKHVGDIAELVDLVHPRYGILTSVGPQHLETFGSIENVANTKYELIEGLPEDGVAFFPNDGGITLELYRKTPLKKVLFALEGEADEWDVAARDLETGEFGSKFTVVYGDKSFTAQCKLLGKHNVLNVLGCVAIALELGLSPEQIQAGIAKIQPVEHRLQLLPTGNGVTVIDDAFNANPAGTRVAMEVLKSFSGRKIVVTPGMVELGAMEEQENRLFGENMAGVADLVYLVGPKHTRPIYDGLQAAGFDMQQVFVCDSLEEASAQMGQILRAGDVVLFENDLPDNYNEF